MNRRLLLLSFILLSLPVSGKGDEAPPVCCRIGDGSNGSAIASMNRTQPDGEKQIRNLM
jgi:hypothetical protein